MIFFKKTRFWHIFMSQILIILLILLAIYCFYRNFKIAGTITVLGLMIISFFVSRLFFSLLVEQRENERLMIRLQKLEKMRQEFVANVSHELKTPITLVKGFVETLIEGASENPKDLKRFLSIIHVHSDRLNGIIEDLLTLSKIEQEKDGATLSFSKVKVNSILERAIQLSDPHAKEKQVSLRLQCDMALKLNLNPPLMEQAFVNLLDNAIKYSPKHGVVNCKIENFKNKVEVSISDQGPGIEEKHLKKLFQRFYRVDKARSRKQGGTGLGLAIVKHIAQAHGGSVYVTSEFGKGSTFYIVLNLS